MPIDFDELERLTRLVESANIQELTVRQGDSRITIRKQRGGTSMVGRHEPHGGEPAGDLDVESSEAGFVRLEASEIFSVNAPLVGFFHHHKPPVTVGAHVERGQILGSIEAMKLETALQAEAPGVVIDVLVEDGQAVEYGQPLFAIRTEEDAT
jgi:acetyl-CoA carboxylase biotin carboxyl carrier protein